jgi:hypothetical protein
MRTKEEWIELLKTDVGKFNEERPVELDLSGADLSGADLRGADFGGADIKGVKFYDADLREAVFCYAILGGASFSGSNLSGADFDYTNLDFACRTLTITHDERLLYQRIYHLCAANCTAPEFPKIKKFLKKYANRFHRVEECGKII